MGPRAEKARARGEERGLTGGLELGLPQVGGPELGEHGHGGARSEGPQVALELGLAQWEGRNVYRVESTAGLARLMLCKLVELHKL